MPYSVFREIVRDIRDMGYKKKLVTGKPTIPLELLVLTCLRIIAAGCPFEMAQELSHIGTETIRTFMYKYFLNWGAKKSKDVIKMPTTFEERHQVIGRYERIGLPGCTGSIDCVHVVWDNCPACMFHECKGKDKVPTLAFEVVCDHGRKILHVSRAFKGCTNDKTIAHQDPVFQMLKGVGNYENHYLSSLRWQTVGADERVTEHVGAYLISDGGYHRWLCLATACATQPEGPVENWSKRMESIRKDIECLFGILKKKFLMLKNPIRWAIMNNISRLFLTCCVIHNMVFEVEGTADWMIGEEDLEVYDPLAATVRREALETCNYRDGVPGTRSRHRHRFRIRPEEEESEVAENVGRYEHELFEERRNKLIEHYNYMRRNRLIDTNL